MSRLTASLTAHGGCTVPEPLDLAWTWMEDQGWGADRDGVWCIVPDPDHTGSIFADQVRLPAALADVDHVRLTPIAVITHGGDVAAMWRDDHGGIQFVALGADGDTLTLAETAIDFLRLVAVNGPATFRAWVESTFDVEVLDRWTAPNNDEFTDWVAAVQNGESDDTRLVELLPLGNQVDNLFAGTPLAQLRAQVRSVGEKAKVAAIQHVDGTVRYGWTDGAGAVTAWWFTPDDRAMLLVFDHASELNLYGQPDDFVRQEAWYDGVPDELVALARNRDPDETLLLNCADGDETVHAATGIFFFDGSTWYIAGGLLRELNRRDLTIAETGATACLAAYGFGTPFVPESS